MNELISLLSGYGFPGAIIVVAIFFIYRMQDINQKERSEWREQTAKQHTEISDIAKNTYTILSEIRIMIHGGKK